MAKGIWHGSAKADDPIYSEPLLIGTVRHASDYLKEIHNREDKEEQGSSSQPQNEKE